MITFLIFSPRIISNVLEDLVLLTPGAISKKSLKLSHISERLNNNWISFVGCSSLITTSHERDKLEEECTR